MSSSECGAVFYFFGARAAGTGPRTIVPVGGLPDFRIGSVISRGGRFSRDFRVVRGRPARKRLRRAAGCRFRAADSNGACRVPGPSHSRSMGPGRRTARAVALWENLARNLESLRLRRPHVSRGDTYQGHFCSSALLSCLSLVEHPLRCRWSLRGAALVAVELKYVNEEMIRSTNLARLLPRSEMRLPL